MNLKNRILLLAMTIFLSAPVFARGPVLETLDGKPFATAQLPDNALVMFWSPDCTFCRQEFAEIRRDADAEFLARLVLVALLPYQAVDAKAHGLPMASLSLASRAAPADVAELFGNAEGWMPYAIVTGTGGTVCRRLTGKTALAQMREAIAACRDSAPPYNR